MVSAGSASMNAASAWTVGCSKRSTRRNRGARGLSLVKMAMASSEWPPRSKKLWWTSTSARPSDSCHNAATAFSASVDGGWVSRAHHQRGRGQARAIDLAVGRLRQRLHGHDGAREHVEREPIPQEPPQPVGQRGVGGRDHVGHERLGALGPAHGHRALAHVRVAADRSLDLPELQAITADLHLVVGPPEELELAAGQPAHAVARAVDARAGPAAPGVGHEPLGGEVGTAEVPARHARPADHGLPHRAAGRQPQGCSATWTSVRAMGRPMGTASRSSSAPAW